MNRNLFEGQNKDENIIDVYRRHFSLVLIYIMLPILLLILSFLVLGNDLNINIFYLCVFSFVISLILLLNKLIPWWFTFYILTSQRIKFVNQKSLFRKSVLDIKFSDIEHITYGTANVWQELINTPTLNLQIVGGDLEIRGVARSTDLYNNLQNLLINKGRNEY